MIGLRNPGFIGALIKKPVWSNNVVTNIGSNGASSPGIINIFYRRSIVMFSYTSSELRGALNNRTSGQIMGLRFYVVSQPTYQPLPNYAIGMKNGSFSGNPGNTGYTIVKPAASESFSTGTTKTFLFTNPFVWTGGDLAFAFAWGQCPTNYHSSGQTYITNGTLYYTWTDSSGTYVINTDSAGSTSSNARPVLQLLYV